EPSPGPTATRTIPTPTATTRASTSTTCERAGARSGAVGEAAVEPRAGDGPAPLDGRRREVHHVGRLLHREPREVAQLGDACGLGVEPRERVEGAVHAEDLRGVERAGVGDGAVERDGVP